MPAPTLAELVRAGLLQRKPPDIGRVSGWLDRSRKDLALAKDVLAGVDRDRAMAVAYEAGYRCCAGLLDLAGYRVTSQPGHHRAAIDATTTLLGDAERARLRRLDRARRFRNDTLYGDMATAGAAEFAQLLRDVDWLLQRLATELERATPRDGR
jgi:hypothetical protein